MPVQSHRHATPYNDEWRRRFPKLAELSGTWTRFEGGRTWGCCRALLTDLESARDIEGVACSGRGGTGGTRSASRPWYECWRSAGGAGTVTPIHDHHGCSCAFKVVEGVGDRGAVQA